MENCVMWFLVLVQLSVVTLIWYWHFFSQAFVLSVRTVETLHNISLQHLHTCVRKLDISRSVRLTAPPIMTESFIRWRRPLNSDESVRWACWWVLFSLPWAQWWKCAFACAFINGRSGTSIVISIECTPFWLIKKTCNSLSVNTQFC